MSSANPSIKREKLSKALREERAAHAATMAVLADYIAEKNLPERQPEWLLALFDHRELLIDALVGWEFEDGSCRECDCYSVCAIDCRKAHLLRVLVGPTETQRQVDAAHDEAMNEQGAQFGLRPRPAPTDYGTLNQMFRDVYGGQIIEGWQHMTGLAEWVGWPPARNLPPAALDADTAAGVIYSSTDGQSSVELCGECKQVAWAHLDTCSLGGRQA